MKVSVKYQGAVGFKGSKMVARCQGKVKTVNYDCGMSLERNKIAAIEAIASKLGVAFSTIKEVDNNHYQLVK